MNTDLRPIISALIISVVLLSCGNNNITPTPLFATDIRRPESTTVEALRNKLADYIHSTNINIGVAVKHLEEQDTMSINSHRHYPMMSVCKFPQAMALLHLVDDGGLSSNTRVHITKEDLKQRTFSTLLNDHPKAPFDLTLEEAFAYSIGQSDNVTSNVIFAMEGGPAAVESYAHSIGITDIGVATDYWHMHNDSLNKNWITPVAAVTLLDKFFMQKVLSDKSIAILWKAMKESSNGRNRLPGHLPAGTVVGHKTGTSARDSENAIQAFNDIGIIELPNDEHIAIAVFISSSTLSDDENAKVIAEIGRMVWDHYTARTSTK